jgi:hypothetical protein
MKQLSSRRRYDWETHRYPSAQGPRNDGAEGVKTKLHAVCTGHEMEITGTKK